MIKSLSVWSFTQVLLFVTCNLCLAQQPTCQSNDCDGTDWCCVASDYCTTEHTLIEDQHCRNPSQRLPSETPLIPGVEYCPYISSLQTINHVPTLM